MAGQPKRGLDYVGWNVRIFEDDTRIDELLDSQGWIGYSIYHYLFLKASASDGYFYRWNYSNAATTARKMGGGISSETVKQTVSLCLRLGLFDNRLFDKEGILTSKEIQLRYMIAIEKRSVAGRTIEPKYWLLNRDETRAYVVIPSNEHFLPENEHSLPENTTKKRRQKESKVNEMSSSLSAEKIQELLTADEYSHLCEISDRNTVNRYINKIIEWQNKNNKRCKSPFETIRKWIDEDQQKQKSKETSYDLKDFEEYAMNFRLYGDDENN